MGVEGRGGEGEVVEVWWVGWEGGREKSSQRKETCIGF